MHVCASASDAKGNETQSALPLDTLLETFVLAARGACDTDGDDNRDVLASTEATDFSVTDQWSRP